MCKELSRLQKVELNEIWETEPQHFTPWLAEEHNLNLLGDTLGLELELHAVEYPSGEFRADIICNNEDETVVLIENQLGDTDHKHLGQILTYSANLEANTVVWIAKKFRDEHKEALDRLNKITDDEYSYFGVEINVWKIDNSKPAPMFDVVSKPNDSSPKFTQNRLNDWKTNFWYHLNEKFNEKNLSYTIKTPGSYNSVQFGLGNSNEYSMRVRISKQLKRISVHLALTGDDAKSYYNLLKEEKEDIETKIDGELEWRPAGKTSYVLALNKEETDPRNAEDWKAQHDWITSKMVTFDDVFRKRLAYIDPSDWEINESEDNE